jgi:hypothetical protein
MGATVTTDPLTFSCVFSDGKRATFALDELACPELARDLLTGLAGLIHPHGSADAAGTVDLYVLALKNMVKTLAGWGFTGGARQLTRVQLAEYWMGATVSREACTRRMLQAFHAATAGLAAGAGELAAGRAYNPQANRRPLPAYRDSEWGRLIETCRALTGESYAAHKRALASAGRGRDPREGGWTADNLRWLLARTGRRHWLMSANTQLSHRSRSCRAPWSRPWPGHRRPAAAACRSAALRTLPRRSPRRPARHTARRDRGGTAAPATAEPATSPHDQRTRSRPPARRTHPAGPSGTHTAGPGTSAAPGTPGTA